MATPTPDFYNPQTVGTLYRVPYQTRAAEATTYAKNNHLTAACTDQARICLLAIDVQNTFCLPDFELFVGGRSGTGAIDDTRRLCEFIYRNLDVITEIVPTMDTHSAAQIFHAVFWVDEAGEHPAPMTTISYEDVQSGKWRVNPAMVQMLSTDLTATDIKAFARHYTRQLGDRNKYPLTIWPYHSMLGGVGHALVSAFEEACFFHNIARNSQTRFEAKGDNPLTENYSVLSPEVLSDSVGNAIAQKNTSLIQHLLACDMVIVAGQAKSHCVAWTISDLLDEIQATNPALAKKIYLLNDCTSSVVVPDVVDFTDAGESAYQTFCDAGMHLVKSTDAIETWPNLPL